MFRKFKELYLGFLSLLIGMKVTIRNYFAPKVTLEYPFKKQAMKTRFRGMVDLKPEACVICYQCIRICPTSALSLAHQQKDDPAAPAKKIKEITKFDFNAELCCFCGLCEEICPTDAIFLNKLYEVSTMSHDDLLRIDLMDANKYNHVDPTYSYEKEAKIKDSKKATPVAKAAAATTAPAATAVAANPVQSTQPQAEAPKLESTQPAPQEKPKEA